MHFSKILEIRQFHSIANSIGQFFPLLYVRMSGGFWQLRENMTTLPEKHLRKILHTAYHGYMKKNGFYIGETATFRSIPLFPHGLHGIYISGGASIGEHCVIFPQVIIGSNTLMNSKGKGAPCIGDRCYIGAGAMIIGNVKIGNNCRIGANTTVSRDIPNNCVVINQEPRILQKSDLDNTWTPFT